MRYEFIEGWAQLPEGMRIGDVGGVAVGPDDEVYVFHRGEHPMLVFDRDGRLQDHWGDGIFKQPHGLALERDGCLYCTDDGDHTLRKFDLKGRLLMTIGIAGEPSGFLSGEPFNRCTHSALAPDGNIYVTDGYRNACVHCFSPQGRRLFSWGRSGSAPGEFQVPHNIVCDEAGQLYVADRENHRVQVFDGKGEWRRQMVYMMRPMALALRKLDGARDPLMFVGEAGPTFNNAFTGLGPRVSVMSLDGEVVVRVGDGYGHATDQFLAPHGIAVDSRGDVYVGEVAHAAWKVLHPGEAPPADLRTLRKLRRVQEH